MITKTGKETAEKPKGILDRFIFSNKGINPDITDDAVIEVMRRKYNIDPAVGYSAPNTLHNAFYAKRKDLEIPKDSDNMWRYKVLDHFGVKGPRKKYDGTAIPMRRLLDGRDPEDDIVFMDGSLRDYNPAIIGHEMGHAANNKEESIHGIINRLRANPVVMGANAAGGMVGSFGAEAGNVPMAVAGYSIPALISAATVLEEREASRKSKDALKELGQEEDVPSLNRALATYGLAAGGAALGGAAGIRRALQARKAQRVASEATNF